MRFGRRERQRRRVEARVEAADADSTKFGVVAPGDEQAHLAFERDEQHARLEQRGEEPEPLLVELERADEVDLQHEHAASSVGSAHLQHAEDGDVAGDLDDDAERDG